MKALWLWLLPAWLAAASITIELPPESLAQWYQPQNQRNLWLHNMFKLRRAQQAIQYYAQQKNAPRVQAWFDRFQTAYLAIGQMVPEWQDELEIEWLAEMKAAIAEQDWSKLQRLQKKINQSCQACHADYRAITALLYRSPRFDEAELMQKLAYQLNRIVIALKDGEELPIADLQQSLPELQKTCSRCHQHNPFDIQSAQAQLKQIAEQRSGRLLGEFAVHYCANCHAVHRIQSDLQQWLREQTTE